LQAGYQKTYGWKKEKKGRQDDWMEYTTLKTKKGFAKDGEKLLAPRKLSVSFQESR